MEKKYILCKSNGPLLLWSDTGEHNIIGQNINAPLYCLPSENNSQWNCSRFFFLLNTHVLQLVKYCTIFYF